MSVLLQTSLCVVLLSAAGCAVFQPAKGTRQPPPTLTPDITLVGKVVLVNPTARYVVLNFPAGHMAVAGQVLHVYRKDMKVGEVTVNGLQRDDNAVADISAGEAQIGDQVRDR
jgi:hypothetical protein